ncbi:ABC transporter substrate-binding protein [Streptomyces sp. B-S-A8]|uniref:ABC transporter substrate-binding protein n=1 Tax=Streptomyces solicavernae TaxID=3043614 RepID=A0ABT6RXI6_9ACTN|nr:ABC transporter substrate-binding protein [Streptomyces sp. B-S-A8]MDI3389151.1 ABC transporter substrate-binding protein [Streptomyces sp. B-S-A8]
MKQAGNRVKRADKQTVTGLGCALVLLSGCAGGGPGAAGEQDAARGKIVLGHYAHSSIPFPATIAVEQGFFKEEGLDVQLLNAKSGPELAAQLIGGSTQIATVSPDNIIPAIEQGQPITLLPPYGKLDMLFAAPKSSGITDVKQLAGKRLGIVARGTASEKYARAMFKKVGVNPASVTFVAVGGAVTQEPALRNGKVDAVVGSTSSYLTMRSHGLDVVAFSDALAGDAGELSRNGLQVLWATTKEYKAEHPETVDKFCRALGSAVKWINDDANKEAGTESLATLLGIDAKAAGKLWDAVHTSFVTDTDDATWKANVKFSVGSPDAVPFSAVDNTCGT